MRATASLIALAALAACSSRYVPPDTMKPVGAAASGQPRQEVLVRTVFRADAAMAELPAASCVITGPGTNSRFTTPHRLTIPVQAEASPTFDITCDALIGASKRRASVSLAPQDPDSEGRIYPERIFVVYR